MATPPAKKVPDPKFPLGLIDADDLSILDDFELSADDVTSVAWLVGVHRVRPLAGQQKHGAVSEVPIRAEVNGSSCHFGTVTQNRLVRPNKLAIKAEGIHPDADGLAERRRKPGKRVSVRTLPDKNEPHLEVVNLLLVG